MVRQSRGPRLRIRKVGSRSRHHMLCPSAARRRYALLVNHLEKTRNGVTHSLSAVAPGSHARAVAMFAYCWPRRWLVQARSSPRTDRQHRTVPTKHCISPFPLHRALGCGSRAQVPSNGARFACAPVVHRVFQNRRVIASTSFASLRPWRRAGPRPADPSSV